MTNINEVEEMVRDSVEIGADYAIIVTDMFDLTVYVLAVEAYKFDEIYNKLKSEPMTMIMEVYDLSMDIDKQLNEKRAFHYPWSKE